MLKKYPWLVVFLILLSLFRFYLTTGGGQGLWPDEIRYTASILVVEHLAQGEILKAFSSLFAAHGRPGFVLFNTIPAALSRVIPNRLSFIDIPAIFNVCISILVSMIFFNTLLMLTGSPGQSLWGTVIYSLLCNTNLYIRHFLPYDLALLIFMLALFLALKANINQAMTEKAAIICGILSGLAYTVYPGFYLFVLVILAVIAYTPATRKMRFMAVHLLSAGGVLLFWQTISWIARMPYLQPNPHFQGNKLLEIIWRLAGNTYFHQSYQLSGTVLQGSFEEGYIFLFRYLSSVEGLIGYAIIVLGLFHIIFLLAGFRHPAPERPVFIALTCGYLFHATMAVVFHKMVFYGRMMHIYTPFLVMGTVLTLQRIPQEKPRILSISVLSVLSLISFAGFVSQYSRLSYPEYIHSSIPAVPEQSIYWITEHERIDPAILKRCSVVSVNDRIFPAVSEEFYPINLSPDMVLVKSAPHPLNFLAYDYEMYSIIERQRLQERKYQMKLFIRPGSRPGGGHA